MLTDKEGFREMDLAADGVQGEEVAFGFGGDAGAKLEDSGGGEALPSGW